MPGGNVETTYEVGGPEIDSKANNTEFRIELKAVVVFVVEASEIC